MEIVYVYQKKRAEFGRNPDFSDRQAELIVDINPEAEAREDYITREPCEMAIQCSKEFSEHEVNTERVESESRGMCHLEGGWPKDVDPNEVEQVTRFRKKVEKLEGYSEAIVDLASEVEHCIKQNSAIDIYEDYFPDSTSQPLNLSPPSAKTLNIFRDPNGIARPPNCISWYPDNASRFAAAYCIMDFQKTHPDTSMDSYIWNVEYPNQPEFTLTPSSPLVSIDYSPKDVHVLVGGMYNGQIAVWDTRKGSRPIETSPIEKSHRDPVFGCKFMASKTGSECFSCSTDGRVLWWDIRKLSEPTDSLDIDVNGRLKGCVALEYESTLPTRFMLGTEDGSVIGGNRKAKTAAEKIAAIYPGHHGPIYSLTRNPFFPKYFMSVGDWTARIWSEDNKESPIMWSKYHTSYLTAGCWSPTRPAVAYTAKADGSIDVWDYLFKSGEPALTVQVSDAAISSMSVQAHGELVACGAKDGTITLVEVNDVLSKIQNNEKPNTSALFDREASREKTLASRMREIRLMRSQRAHSAKKQEAARPGSAAAPPAGAEGGAEEEEEEDPIAMAEKAFWEAVAPNEPGAAPETDGDNEAA